MNLAKAAAALLARADGQGGVGPDKRTFTSSGGSLLRSGASQNLPLICPLKDVRR